jgi:hypothetical protein
MKPWIRLSLGFLLGMTVGIGLVVILYCLTIPAKPFVYVGF